MCDASIILLHEGEQTGKCLERILAASAGVDYELVPAHNTAESPDYALKPELSKRTVHIHHTTRSGWPAACNESAAAADGKYLIFICGHVLPNEGWLEELLPFASEHPEFSAIGLHVVGVDGSERPMGASFASARRPAHAFSDLEERGMVRLDRRSLPIIGDGCLVVNAEAFAEVGGFAERLSPRGAMLDLCLKLLARGKQVAFHPGCILVSHSAPINPAEEARTASMLRRRWGVEAGTSENRLWVDGRDTSPDQLRFKGAVGHFPGEATRVPPPFVEVGHRTYFGNGARFLTWTSEERIRIGSYCSFASNVTIFTGGGHSTDTVSTFPFEVNLFGSTHPTRSFRTTRDTVIGSDVWVGDGATIMGGVQVGHGAVISTSAVVFEDVPPYAIVAGNPAQILRHRFSKPTVEALLRIAWWNWTEEKIKAEMEWFFRPIPDFVTHFDIKENHAEAAHIA